MKPKDYQHTQLPQKGFQKRVESFTCEICGNTTDGTGYTDHCPHCLWSKHVDINPGDRAADCGGTMKPVGCTKKGEKYTIHYVCTVCGKKHTVRSAPDDNMEILTELSTLPIPV